MMSANIRFLGADILKITHSCPQLLEAYKNGRFSEKSIDLEPLKSEPNVAASIYCPHCLTLFVQEERPDHEDTYPNSEDIDAEKYGQVSDK